jgi:pimeloyl-ACP methyl ester carboxylesterase
MRSQTNILPTDPLIDVGSGFPILLLPGHTLDLGSWMVVIEKLSRAYRLIVPRLPFHSYPLCETRRIDIVSYISHFIDMNLLDRVIMIGSGTAAEGALEFASKFPDKIYKMIITGPIEKSETGQLLPESMTSKQHLHQQEEIIKRLFFEKHSESYPSLMLLANLSFSSVTPTELGYTYYPSCPVSHPAHLLERIQEFILHKNKDHYIL